MPIRLLSATLIDQIAAGEVIERPASVVKELIENALDAGARRIDIDIEQGGLGLVRVRDDGLGIAAAELPLAVQRHATSKIATLEDLEAVVSLGFRGEALPSIGSVARLRIYSRTADAEAATELRVEGGVATAPQPAAHPAGTTIEVRELFYNVPARRKFVRTESTEFSHIARTIERLSLAAPAVAFRVRHNGRQTLDLPAAHDAAGRDERVARVLGTEFLGRSLPIAQDGALQLTGWLGLPRPRVPIPTGNSGTSTVGRCATGCSATPHGWAIATCSITAVTQATCSTCASTHGWWTSTRTLRSSSCAFAIAVPYTATCSGPSSAHWRRTRPAAARRPRRCPTLRDGRRRRRHSASTSGRRAPCRMGRAACLPRPLPCR